nr:8450_t:CDS:2 [Entrophospora candida]
MSKFKTTPPLVTLNETNKIEIHLHEPLIQKPRSRKKRIGLQILNTLARLEVLLDKEESLASSDTKIVNLNQQQFNKKEIENALSVLETIIFQLEGEAAPKKDIQAYLSESGLGGLFPKSAKRLAPNTTLFNDSSNKMNATAHFHETNLYNQLVSVSLQLQQDIKLTNHKYMAHQLALLYQCLNQVGGPFLKYRSRVELHFDAIKALSNSSEEPQLDEEQKKWLSELTADIVTGALFSGRPTTTMSQPVAAYLNKIGDMTIANKTILD